MKAFLKVTISFLAVYVVIAYLLIPALWVHYESHPAVQNSPKTTQTKEGIPGDPLNVGLIGSQSEVIYALLKAGWHPADPITLKTSLEIAESVLIGRSYPDAPVSNLYLWGRRQDLAFEKLLGNNARQRHHVRLWRSDELSMGGRPLWIAAATFDRGVGVSHRTGQVTHHIAPDVDKERDDLMEDLKNAGQLTILFQVTGVGVTLKGRNGGGDWYYTDGEITIGTISRNNETNLQMTEIKSNPLPIQLKNNGFEIVKNIFKITNKTTDL